MASDHPNHVLTNVKTVEKIDDKSAPQVVEHLSTGGECSNAISTLNLENQTQINNGVLEDKKMKAREKKREKKRRSRARRVLAKSSATLDYVTSPSALEMQEIDAKSSNLKPADQAPATANTKKLMGEVIEENSVPGKCSATGSSKDLEGHTQVDNNSETKEIKSKKRGKRVKEVPRKKKRKLTSNSNLPSTEDIYENSVEGFPLKVSNKVLVPSHTDELIGDMVSGHDPSFLIKQNDLNPIGKPAGGDQEEIKTEVLENSVEGNGNLYDVSLKDISDKCSEGFNKSKFNLERVTLNLEPMSQDGVTISSELSESSDGDDVSPPDITKEVPQSSPLGVHSGTLRRKLLVLDINGILTDIVNFASEEYTPDMILSRKAVFKRPFCDDFMKFCFEKFDVGIWSSRTMKNVKSAVDFLMGELQTKLLFCWDQSQCTDTGFNTLENREKPMLLKELKKLWEKHDQGLPWEKGVYDESNTLLLDDSPYKALRNPPYTAVFPIAYCYKNVKDNSLGPGGDLRVYLEGLALADDVQKYVEANPFGQRAITSGNASWNFYRKVIHDTSLPVKKSYNHQSSSKEYGLRQRHR